MDIHALSARALLAALRARALSSVEITTALQARMDAVDPCVHAFVHVFREQALEQARRSDEARARGETLGPLAGLPITVKENFATAGTPVTLGLRARLGEPAREDAAIVATAREAGALVLGKTNIPLFLLSMETNNDIWGTTLNPWDTRRSPGGSSGGEAAAIATGCSPLGIGSDIGGSVRIPCAWTGIAGLKPTVGLWTARGQRAGLPGQEGIRSSAGPLARTVDDLVLAMQALSPERQRRFDPRVPPLPLGDPSAVDLRGLTVGFYEDDGFLGPSLAVRRAVREAASALEAAGATVVPYSPPKSWEMVRLYFAALSADGGATLRAQLGDQPVTPQLTSLMNILRVPELGRRALSRVMAARGEARVAALLDVLGEKPVAVWWALTAQRNVFQADELAAWQAQGLDLVVGPPTVTPAALLGQTGDWSMGAWHTMRYNLLDLPAGIVPATRVRPEEATRPEARDRLEKKAASFDAGSAGLPVAVQVIGRPWEEHRVLAAMAALEAVFVASPDFPRTPIDPVLRNDKVLQ